MLIIACQWKIQTIIEINSQKKVDIKYQAMHFKTNKEK